MKQIAIRLNEDGAPSPRAQQGRPKGWAPSSIREVLYRDVYRGQVVWNRSRKRNGWGLRQQRPRPEGEWFRHTSPELRIVTDEQWNAAHTRLAEARALYLRGTGGQLLGQPARGTDSKYLLVGLAKCGVCGAGVSVRSRSHGRRRAYYYVCTAYHTRGRVICANKYELPMLAADQAVLEAIREQVLSESLIELIFTRAIERLDVAARDAGPDRDATRRELTAVEGELARLTTAIAAGGDLPSVLSAVRERERRRKDLLARLETLNACERQPVANRNALGGLLRAKLVDWQGPLSQHTAQARQLLRKVVVGRLTVTPEADVRESAITGTATLEKFVSGAVLPKGMASPTGSDGEWMAIDAWMPK